MAPYSAKSIANLLGVHPDVVRVMNTASKFLNLSILGGTRTVAEEQQKVAAGLSTTMNSKHLVQPDGFGHAVDAAPFPQDFDDSPRRGHTDSDVITQFDLDMIYQAGMIMGIALMLNVPLRYGGDWDRDGRNVATGFKDLDHFELHPEPTQGS